MSDNTNTIEATVEGSAVAPVSDDQQQLSQQQEQVLKRGEVPSIEELKAMQEAGDLEFEDFEELVRNGEITPDQFQEILQVPYEGATEASQEAAEAAEAKDQPGVGHNKPPAEVDPIAEELRDIIRHNYKPLVASDSESAINNARETLGDLLEYQTKGETSLRSSLAISLADYVYFNTEGLAANGNKLLHINKGMYQEILKSAAELVPEEDRTSSFTATVGSSVEACMLLMTGRAHAGWFVLSPDRKAVRQSDIASLEYPQDVPEGCKVLRGLCVPDNVLTPRVPVLHNGKIMDIQDNPSTDLVLLPNYAAKALYNSLWDKDGEMQYAIGEVGAAANPKVTTGRIIGFESGKDVLARRKWEADKAAKDAAEAAKAQQQPASRAPGGTQAEPVVPPAVNKMREMLNNSSEIKGENLSKLKEGFAEIVAKFDDQTRRFQQLLAAQAGDLLSNIPAIGSLIDEQGSKFPEASAMHLCEDMHKLIRRALLQTKQAPSKELVRHLVVVLRDLNDVIDDTPDDTVVWMDIDGNPIKSYDNISRISAK